MKMPASGGDPVSTTLRLAFSPSSKAELDCGIEASAKRVLLSRIEFEPTTNYQSSVLSSLKSKYIVINHKAHADGAKTIVNGTSGNKKSNNVTLPVPKLTLFPPERVQLGYRGNTNIGSGMANMGNTCYLNSTLQALFHVPALVNWLMSETAHQKCEQNSDYQMHPDDITCSVIKTFKCSQQKTGACMKPISVYSKLKAICKHLSHGSQEDAHEFMRYLLESLEKSYLTRFQGHKLDSASKETTPINQIFGGYIRTEVTCLSCNAVSTTFQHFQDLPLDIRKASTLNDALAGYFERERLPEGEDAYKCEKCNRKVPATKKFSIEKPPNVLCIQLKRFSAANGKITKQVQLPENLDVTRFTSPSVQPRHPVTYKLVSMVTHMGQSANCGHYTAIALASNNRYYQFDDSSVRQIPTCTVLSMSAYLVLYEIDRPFATVYPRPFSAPAAASWKESPNNGEKPDSWSECESTSTNGNGNGNGIDRESKREGSESGSRVVNQLKHGKVNTPPVSPTREPPSTNHRHGAGPRNGGPESKGTSTSLVPYESDASSESDAENKDRSELERLLTKSCAKGWQVTEQNDSLTDGTKACTTSWDVTEVKIPKFARNLSDTELNGRKKKKVKTSGSDSEVDKISNKSEDKKKRRTSILERYKTNFGGSGSKEGKSSQEINKDGDKKIWSESVNRGFEQSQENSKSKSFQFSRPVAVNGHNGTVNGNGSINSSKNANNNGDTNGNSEDKSGENSPRRSGFDRVTDDDPSEAEEKAFCSSIVREVERKKEIIGVLLQNSHRGYGTSAVKTWNGTQTNFEREAEEERRESTKRTYDSYYNDEFDKGKAKKLKTDDYSKERDRPRYNAFQERANQQQHQHHHHNHHWRSNNGGRYPSDFRRHNKQKPFNSGYYNKNNNWNYRRKKNFPNYKHSSYNNYRH